MKTLLSVAAVLVQTLCLSFSVQAQTLDEIFESSQSLCGAPVLESSNQEEGQVTLRIEGGSVTILFDEETTEEAFSFMRSTPYQLTMCIPVEDASLITPDQIIAAEWFACWSPAGAGISVSNQRTTSGMPPLVPGAKPLIPAVKPLVPAVKPLIPRINPLVGGRPIVGGAMPIGGKGMPIFVEPKAITSNIGE